MLDGITVNAQNQTNGPLILKKGGRITNAHITMPKANLNQPRGVSFILFPFFALFSFFLSSFPLFSPFFISFLKVWLGAFDA